MKVGFTGTRYGMTPSQMGEFLATMTQTLGVTEFHHGDCIGADAEAAEMMRRTHLGAMRTWEIFVHPPEDEAHRAFTEGYDKMLPAKMHFARNRDIVDACDILVACPNTMSDQSHGGTWYTIHYAMKKHKPVTIIWPDGRAEIRQ